MIRQYGDKIYIAHTSIKPIQKELIMKFHSEKGLRSMLLVSLQQPVGNLRMDHYDVFIMLWSTDPAISNADI